MSQKKIYFHQSKVIAFIEGNQWGAAASELNDTFKLTIQCEKPQPLNVSEECIQGLADVLERMKKPITENKTESLTTLRELFKALRNCVILNKSVQVSVSENDKLLPDCALLISSLLARKSNVEVKECIKVCLQFLINLVVGNEENGIQVWLKFENAIRIALDDFEYFYSTTALIYNIFLNHKELIKNNASLFEKISSLSYTETNEYVIFISELYYNDDSFPVIFKKLDRKSKRFVLEFIKERLLQKNLVVSEHLLKTLTADFKTKADCILKTVDEYVKQIEPLEVKLLADNIASLSSDEIYLKILQYDKSLLITSAYLLKSLHQWGKASNNEFSPINKISEVTNITLEMENHPIFGFKASLVRLLGNLCWKHKVHQDLIRELEIIPVFLDCCNIDAKNPFIIQWVILTIRNICEGNEANQAFISSINLKEPVSSSILEEMGLVLHSDGKSKTGLISMDVLK